MERIFLVIDTALGWDNVVAVLTKEEDAKAMVEDRNNKFDDTSIYQDKLIDDPDFENGIYIG